MSDVAFSVASPRGECVARAHAGFKATFNTEPAGIYSAPGRVNVIGEHVDYQAGLCLPMAISHRAYVAMRRTPDRNELRLATSYTSGTVTLAASALTPTDAQGSWAGYLAGVYWALRMKFPEHIAGGFDLYLHSEVPSGAGLSSSAAIECATALAINTEFAVGASDFDLIAAAIRAENEFVGAATGGLDQSASILCQTGHALLLDCQDTSTTQIAWDLASQDLALLVIDTRAPHSLSDGQYNNRRAASEAAAALLGAQTLREYSDANPCEIAVAEKIIADAAPVNAPELISRTRHILSEIQRTQQFAVLLANGSVRDNLAPIGALLNASHDSLRYDYEVTCPELDVAVTSARAAGAHGARMTGGGFGGSAIALVEAATALDVAAAVAAEFTVQGFAAPQFFVATAAQGACRER